MHNHLIIKVFVHRTFCAKFFFPKYKTLKIGHQTHYKHFTSFQKNIKNCSQSVMCRRKERLMTKCHASKKNKQKETLLAKCQKCVKNICNRMIRLLTMTHLKKFTNKSRIKYWFGNATITVRHANNKIGKAYSL